MVIITILPYKFGYFNLEEDAKLTLCVGHHSPYYGGQITHRNPVAKHVYKQQQQQHLRMKTDIPELTIAIGNLAFKIDN